MHPLSDSKQNQKEVVGELVSIVRDRIGPVAAFRKVLFVKALPKTRSGKIPRSTLANLVNRKPYKVCEIVISVHCGHVYTAPGTILLVQLSTGVKTVTGTE